MPKIEKVDNRHLRAKLDLRRLALRRWLPGKPLRVLDACQGDGVLWTQLRPDFRVVSYVGMDLKRAPGRLKVDSARVLAQGGWTWNVIDVDTYGAPWDHWLALLPHVRRRTVVYLTWGVVNVRGTSTLGETALRLLGLGELWRRVPPGIQGRLAERIWPYALAAAGPAGCRVVEWAEAIPAGAAHARYFAVCLCPVFSKISLDSSRSCRTISTKGENTSARNLRGA